MSLKNTKKNLTGLQAIAVEAYRQRLAEIVPEVEILDAFATQHIVEVILNDSIRDFATAQQITKLWFEVEDLFNVRLMPYVIPHEN
jgi:cobalamin biosynthesis Co2+ chelatase CbiK